MSRELRGFCAKKKSERFKAYPFLFAQLANRRDDPLLVGSDLCSKSVAGAAISSGEIGMSIS
ncbi:hypothetical protein CWS35_37600 (plasmid) [Bradyrhizobium sp. SK17]|nr:hypothetical protein CWS35_37600 [Bradyrhizobium sp. SK17]